MHTRGGKVFGAFTDTEWDQTSGFNKAKSFIFSLDNGNIYYNSCGISIYSKKGWGPCFGYGIEIVTNCNENYNSYFDPNDDCFQLKNVLLTESRYFSILDYAVYQIKFNN